MSDIFEKIRKEIDSTRVVLFMKGTAQSPLCGFSATVVQILQKLGVQFKDLNVLADEELRAGIKQFSNWPTIPQLYIDGKLVGGCDITKEMYDSGQLAKLLAQS